MLSKHTLSFIRKPKVSPHQENPVDKFKQVITKEFLAFKDDVHAPTRGIIALADSWKDWMGIAGLSSAFVGGTVVISALASVAILTSIVSMGIGAGIVLIGIGAEVGYVLYRSKKKKKEFRHAIELLNVDNLKKDLALVADLLADIYANQLASMTEKNAERLAQSLLKGIKYEILKNKNFKYTDLLEASSLQASLLKTALHAPKQQIRIGKNKKLKHNARSIITKPALYCRQNDTLYTCKASRPEKYGVLAFNTKRELDDYRLFVQRLKNHHESWNYQKMISMEAEELKKSLTFFSKHKNDKQCEDDSTSNQASPSP